MGTVSCIYRGVKDQGAPASQGQNDIRGQLARPKADPLQPIGCEMIVFMPHARASVLVYREDINPVCITVDQCKDRNAEEEGRFDHRVRAEHHEGRKEGSAHRAGKLSESVLTSCRVATSGYPFP